MGIRKYYNKWRCYIVDKKGNKHQSYFDTEKEAQAHYDKHYKDKVPHARYNKKSNARHQDLQIGVHESFSNKMNTFGIRVRRDFIKSTFKVDGKVKCFVRHFGGNRTRAEAIRLCTEWRKQKQKQKEAKQNEKF